MRLSRLSTTFWLFLSIVVFGGISVAQEQPAGEPAPNQPRDVRNNALRQLGLNRDQIQAMRRLNSARKPMMDAAQMRMRLANRALDEAIYADVPDEAEVAKRLGEFQRAQAEVQRIRFMNEFAVRRLLTPEQLSRFREMRRRFDQQRRQDSVGNASVRTRPSAAIELPDSNLKRPASPARRGLRSVSTKPNF